MIAAKAASGAPAARNSPPPDGRGIFRPMLRRPSLALACALLGIACGGHATPDPTTAASAPLVATPAPTPAPAAEAPEPEPAAEPPAAPDPADPPKVAAALPPLAPLSPEQQATFLAGAGDVLAPTEIHYVKSNEIRHDVFFPYVKDIGGAYVGVGSDQNFTIIAAARAELVFLLDIDQRVVDLHRIYGVLIPESPDPQALLARFAADQEEASVALLEAAFADLPEAERTRLRRAYRTSRETVRVHLGHVIRRTRGGAATGWLSNPEMYAHIRTLFQNGRVRMMGGDLTGTSTLQTFATAARELGVPVRVIYFSNAEEYFKYTPSFTANIQAMVGDSKSVVLRTLYSKDWEHADNLWAYQVQPLADFQARLGDRKNRSRNPMLRYAEQDGSLRRQTGEPGLSLIALEPVRG